jgi:transposase
MANQLKMAIIDTILTLRAQGMSGRGIADVLGIHRDTVAAYLNRADQESKPAIAPPGSESPAAESKPALAPPGSEPGTSLVSEPRGAGRPSECEPWRAVIVGQLELGLSAQRIHQDLTSDHGFTGSYYSVRRFVRGLETDPEFPVRRLECAPGEEVQVDFGTGAPLVLPDGHRRRTHVFRMVLSHSRKAYSEVVLRQTTDDFLRCLENAFAHFGGVPRRIILDNLRAAVTKADWYDPELNPKVEAFARHCGTVFLPTRPYTPRHKGKVERGIDYVQENALKGRTFTSLEEQNQFLRDWEQGVADTRIHGTTRRQVGKVFAEVERAALQPLPIERFPCFHEGQRIVHRDGHVEIQRACYSVPPEYLGRRVWVRWDGRLVRIFTDRMQPIAVHAQREPGRFSTLPEHIVREKISTVERGAAYWLEQVRCLGPHSLRWAEALIAVRGVESVRVLQGLLSLARKHPCDQIERACEIAHSCGAYRLRVVRRLIDRDAPQQQVAFLEEHSLIRPLADCTQFIHDAFQKEAFS